MDGHATVSVKLTPVGRAHTFLLDDLAFEASPAVGDRVVVHTETGEMIGQVVRAIPALQPRRQPESEASPKVIRLATRDDVLLRYKQEHREREAFRIALLKVRERGLAMKLTKAEQTFDGARLIFYFTADGRVDFRELVRELAAEFRTRIEMRQIGVRDEAKMLGGYGSCGRPLCCTTWLQTFEPISIRMAKQQDLSLNPSKLSGLCGRLKCCLRYELPNAHGDLHAGCGHEGACSRSGAGDGAEAGSGGTSGCGGNCGSGGCGSCGH